MEGVTLLFKTTESALKIQRTRRATAVKLACGWCLPALVAGVACAVGLPSETYLDMDEFYKRTKQDGSSVYKKCWLGAENLTLQAWAIAPIAAVWLTNTAIVLRVTWFVYVMSAKTEVLKPSRQEGKQFVNAKHIRAALKSLALLFPVLGIPYLLAFLASKCRTNTACKYWRSNKYRREGGKAPCPHPTIPKL